MINFRNLEKPLKDLPKNVDLVSPTLDVLQWGAPKKDPLPELMEAVEVRRQVQSGVWPAEFMASQGLAEKQEDVPCWLNQIILKEMAENRRGYYTSAAAWLVAMDHPFDLAKAILDYYKPECVNPECEAPFGNFVGDKKETALVNVMVSEALAHVFRVKYFHMEARPVEKLKFFNVDFSSDIEQYPHPNHPAYPAGHGAAAGATFKALNRIYKFNDKQLKEIEEGCKAFAAFRTFSFMHVKSENVDGFELGVEYVESITGEN